MISNNQSKIPDTIKEKIDAIKNDTTHGATALTIETGNVITLFLNESQIQTIDEFSKEFTNILHLLVKSQNSMASIFNFANQILLKLQKNNYRSLEEMKKEIADYCNDFLLALSTTQQSINTFVNDLIENNSIIFTFSNSNTVLDSLIHVHKQGKHINVHCSECRPKNEGLLFTKKLSEHGITTVLSTDAALFSKIKEADMVLTGADSISNQCVINKIGTYALAMLSRCEGVPCYVLCAEEKIIPSDYHLPNESLRDPHEIIPLIPKKTSIINYYFESIPLDFFNGIITQTAIFKPKQLRASIIKSDVHPSFLKEF